LSARYYVDWVYLGLLVYLDEFHIYGLRLQNTGENA
jgi:hypothetical protein